ncbi:hypothetical protein TVAG_497960 [Trichomonas vaginalis G3]|uniref:Uncharacterized protein n=1 Tax=Trichomonas vaginalis (strain ATCC PRA-98 / G3) TaxID=412133 RepID=A2FVB5_TRIV3|nr:hypothetical protein TVAGG3_0148440 [Trichomonas vaginalis G3]EAX91155.1 hypothetical protein TVAG_497960 [Trichomonas vaginalis G3]KAI5547101.1 hypothetical protein TVAGG3_0148440 [Trichomonas vaginalis G3]|eukprot:XP_001304085.1 hypothetical protein [Trichomonas vaginalis G3]
MEYENNGSAESESFALRSYVYQENLDYVKDLNFKTNASKISVLVKCVYPDPENPEQIISKHGSLSISSGKPISQICKEFLATYPEIPNKAYYVSYDQLLFREGTIAQCGITHGKSVELIAPGKNHAANHNEGLFLLVVSFLPFIIGIATIALSMSSETSISTHWKAFFLFLGFLFIIPATLTGIVGMILIPECPMPCYFRGTEWC